MPLVDIGQILHQRQPDTRTDGMELTVITVVEALEKPVDSLLAHAFTAIGDHYTDKTGAFHPHTDFYFPFVGCVFGSVGKQVVDDLIEFVGIEPAFDTVGRTLEVDPKALFRYQRGECLDTFANECRHIALRNPDLQVTTLDLAEFEYLLDEAHQTRRVDRDYVVERLPVCGGAAQAVKRGNDDRQGRHQLVGDIGKELQFRVVQLLGFPAFEFRNADFMLHTQSVAQEADRAVGHPRKGCEIERHGPPRAPGCRQDTHLQHPLVAAPDTVAARRLQMEGINARRQVVVGGEAVL